MKPIRLDVSETPDFAEPASVLGTLAEVADQPGRFVLTLVHPYPDFDVAAGWVARGRGVQLTFNGAREGQRIPCSRG